MTATTEPHQITLDEGIYWCWTEDCDADECEDENRCSHGCVCNTRPDFDLSNELAGKTIEEVLIGKSPSEQGAEPMTILVFDDGSRHGFVLARYDDD